MDPGIAKLIERTRARRGELAELSSDRSPLPSEARQRDRSPLKQTRSPSKVKPSYDNVSWTKHHMLIMNSLVEQPAEEQKCGHHSGGLSLQEGGEEDPVPGESGDERQGSHLARESR